MKLQFNIRLHSKVLVVLGVVLMLVLSIVGVDAATESKKHTWSTNYGGATETVKLTVSLATINNPNVSYEKSGYGEYYNGYAYTYAGIGNTLTKKISGDTATYTNKATPAWTNKVSYASIKGSTKTATFKYEGSLTVN